MLRLFRLLAAVSALLMLLGNSNCSKNNDAGAPQFVTTLAVENQSALPTGGFAQGDPVLLVLTIRNRSNTAQKLFFSGAELTNLAVVDAGSATVEWTCDTGASGSCTTNQSLGSASTGSGFSEIDFTAFETKTITFTWDQTDNSGSQLATGNYEVMGGFTVYNTTGAGNAADNGNSMAQGPPTAAELFPTVYRSVLAPFSIR